ncbi:GNAT family N-acetyltransferase [Micromonospora chalcea]
MTGWSTGVARPDEPDAVLLLREYMAEMVRRWYGRPERPGEVDAALAEDPSDDLAPPTGLLVLARRDGRLAGCAGLRWQPGWAELTRYARHGYREIPAFTSGPYAQHWFEKSLPARVDDATRAR